MTDTTSPPAPTAAPDEKGRRHGKAAFGFIFVTVLLDMLSLGLIIPVLPKLILQFEGGDEQKAAFIVGVFGTVWALMQFVSMPVLGAISDRFGRRPVILISNFGLGLDYLMMALAQNIWWLLLGRIISGICAASFSTANAYIADVTAPERRAQVFGYLGAAFGFGFILGPALGGILGDIDPRLPFMVAGVLSLINAMYGLFVLPESLAPENRRPFTIKTANPIDALRFLASKPAMFNLSAVRFLENLAHIVFPSAFVLLAGHRYGWGPKEVGFALALVGVSSMIVQVFLIRHAMARLGERRMLIAGLIAGTIGFALYGASGEGWMFFMAVAVNALWGLSGPAAQSMLTKQVSPTEQGRLQGALSAIMSIAGMIGPLIFTSVFAFFISKNSSHYIPGAPFYLSALMVGSALFIAWRVVGKTKAT